MPDNLISKLGFQDNATTTAAGTHPANLLLESFFPGFSLLSSAVYRYSSIDLTIYLPALLAVALIIFGWSYVQEWVWEHTQSNLMSTADVRIDDEIYNMLMAWISSQNFAKKSRHFVANTNLNSRMWFLWRSWHDDEDDDEENYDIDEVSGDPVKKIGNKNEKKVQFTPSFGTHYFWYKGRLLIFRRTQDIRQMSWGSASEREEITISSFGRDPSILKELLDECRTDFIKNDENRTIIYRGGLKSGTAEPAWTRCVSRVSRPFSTVVLDESVKIELLVDMKDYLHPFTRRWYSNRGIPYRRGYLLHGPPGTGKSSLSFAIAGYFKLKIYIVSLNSMAMSEENLGSLFTELPKQCVVLLEDIDTAGLTHTRKSADKDEPVKIIAAPNTPSSAVAAATAAANNEEKGNGGRISLSGLLNVLDGVASQEGRILIMTTNHVENLDEALIRPGRVDMIIKFSLATTEMINTIFRAIFATLEGDIPEVVLRLQKKKHIRNISSEKDFKSEEEQKVAAEKKTERKAKEEQEKIERLGDDFAKKIPTLVFSPAEVQGYLLKYKREPEKAIANAEEWVKTMEEEKRKKKEKEAAKAAAAKVVVEEKKEEKVEGNADGDVNGDVNGVDGKNEDKRGEEEDGVVVNGAEKGHEDTRAAKVNGVKKGEEGTHVNGVKAEEG